MGFDQAYVRTDLSPMQLLGELRSATTSGNYGLRHVVIGYFLQFKVVKRMVNRSKAMPPGFYPPYFRSDLDTHRRAANAPSQHELLFSLASNPNAMVYYACPMVFDRVDLYRPQADLDQLVLADVSSAPSPYTDNERHFVSFQQVDSPPTWCSEPILGKGIDPKSFVHRLVQLVQNHDLGSLNRKLLLDFLSSPTQFARSVEDSVPESASQALTVIRVSSNAN